MKNIFLFTAFLFSTFLIGQNSGVLVPPESVRMAFEKQYPKKTVIIWSMEYGETDDDIKFEAKFNETPQTKGYALYDGKGNFKSYKVQIILAKLPKNGQVYLKKNYPINAKTKLNPVKQIFLVQNDKNETRYEAGVIKDKKNYNVVFDKDGTFVRRVQID